nr:RNA dependent RNA polymerase [Metarhizium anisopliae M5 victorivirus 1]
MSNYRSRASNYGPLGAHFADLIDQVPEIGSRFAKENSFLANLISLTNSTSSLKYTHPLLPAAVSLLCLDYPLQEEVSFPDFYAAIREAYALPVSIFDLTPYHGGVPISTDDEMAMKPGRLVRRLIRSSALRDRWFPPKPLQAGETKTNVVLSPLIRSMTVTLGSTVTAALLRPARGLNADVVMGLLIYAAALKHRFGERGLILAFLLVCHPDAGKHVTMVVKGLGLNSTPWGAMLCEANAIQGRGTGDVDLEEAARQRTDTEYVAANIIDCDPDSLRHHVRSILKAELPNPSALPDLDDFWTSRWAWCVNGSQTTASSRALGLDPAYYKATHSRAYRRSASEQVAEEPITSWDGTTYVSASKKLECGKTRTIFACDTRSYFSFSWLLSTVQKDWKNQRVILDPGKGGHLGMAQRIIKCQRGGGLNLMLDYDDFNSQHSTSSMQVVFDEVCKLYGVPDWYRNVLLDSFEKMYLKVGGRWTRVVGTLMSGHRGTTFINSVLNAAYIRAAIGGSRFDKLLSLHTGDDVYIRCNTLGDCADILRLTRAYGCRMNPAKQSIGFNGAEFLRMGIRGDQSYGYLARSVATFVAGNWSSADPLEPLDGIRSAVNGCRAMINRSMGFVGIADLVTPALRYLPALSLRTTIKLFRGEVAIEGSPVFGGNGPLRCVKPEVPKADNVKLPTAWKTCATQDYLTKHVSHIEASALERAGTDGTALLAISSYSKGLDERFVPESGRIQWRKLPPLRVPGYACATDLVNKPPATGILTKYPIINLVKNRLTDQDVRELLIEEIGYVPPGDLRDQAFGAEGSSKRIIGVLSYSDAASFCNRTTSGNIYTLYSVNM